MHHMETNESMNSSRCTHCQKGSLYNAVEHVYGELSRGTNLAVKGLTKGDEESRNVEMTKVKMIFSFC